MNSPSDFVEDQQPVAAGLFAHRGRAGEEAGHDPVAVVSRHPALVHLRRPAPRLGQHNPRCTSTGSVSRRNSWDVEGEMALSELPDCSGGAGPQLRHVRRREHGSNLMAATSVPRW